MTLFATTFEYGVLTFNWYGSRHVSVYNGVDFVESLSFSRTPTTQQVKDTCAAYASKYSESVNI